MNLHAILLPVFVQVALVVALAGVMAARRFAAVKAGEVRRDDVSMGQRAWPARAQAAANAFSNQFELPMLYLALVPLALFTRSADTAFVVLSWVFVLSRLVHAGVYVTTNYIPHRIAAFGIGAVALLVMWIGFAVRTLSAPWPA